MYAEAYKRRLKGYVFHPPAIKIDLNHCEVNYATSRPNFFANGNRISIEILVGVGLHALCSVALRRFVAFSKNVNVQQKIFIVFVSNVQHLEQDIKSRYNLHFLWYILAREIIDLRYFPKF